MIELGHLIGTQVCKDTGAFVCVCVCERERARARACERELCGATRAYV